VCDLTDAVLAFQDKMSYAGAQFVTVGHSFRTYGWGKAGNLVDRLLASFSLEATVSGAKQ
jgi:4-hydroxyphenylacetate 3-monooxygenase